MNAWKIHSVDYKDPWVASYDQRFRDFLSGEKRIAYFYEEPDNSTFRYRVYNMIQVIQDHRDEWGWSAAYFSLKDMGRMDRVVDVADVLIICRTRYTDQIGQMISRAKLRRCKVIYDIDDLVFDCDYVPLILDTLAQDLRNPNVFDFWFAYVSRLGAVLRLCDEAITTNRYLAEKISAFADIPARVIPNFLNSEQMDVSEKVLAAKRSAKNSKGKKTVGYFSGTPSHNRDFEIVSSALNSILREDANVFLRIVGFLEIRGPLKELTARIESVPLQDFMNLQILIGEVDVNIVPLQINEFTHCKSELKYFEAGIVETPTLASPTQLLRDVIVHGENGFLVNSHEWENSLRLILSEDDFRKRLASAAGINSIKYSWKSQSNRIQMVLA